jgi:hypothetical protein
MDIRIKIMNKKRWRVNCLRAWFSMRVKRARPDAGAGLASPSSFFARGLLIEKDRRRGSRIRRSAEL